MKKLTTTALLASLLLLSCDDTVTNVADVHVETEAEQIQEFITHVESDHYGKPTMQDTVLISATPAFTVKGMVYSIVFDGATSGKATFSFSDDEHVRTFITDAKVGLKISEGTKMLSADHTVDLSLFKAATIKQMQEYHVEPDAVHTLEFSAVTVDTLRLFVAPRGLAEEASHDH